MLHDIPGRNSCNCLTRQRIFAYAVFMYSNRKQYQSDLPSVRESRQIDQVRERIRYLHCSLSTGWAYAQWITASVNFHGFWHPVQMGGARVEGSLVWLVAERNASGSAHRQMLSAQATLFQKAPGAGLLRLDPVCHLRKLMQWPLVVAVAADRRALQTMPNPMLGAAPTAQLIS